MKHIFKYKNGHALSYLEIGDRNGYPILIQHGMVASINDHHLFTKLIKAGNRLISAARPGYGHSAPYQMANIAEWGEIVSILVADLNLAQFDVLGISSGAPYSYAIGSMLPHKVRNIYIFSGTPALFAARVQKYWPYPIQQNASISQMAKVAQEVFFSNVTEEDLSKDEIKDSMMNDCFGIAQDLRLRCLDWGFLLSDLKATVYMEHSRADQEVPYITAKMTAQMMPNCQLLSRDGEHFSEERLDQFIENTILRQSENH